MTTSPDGNALLRNLQGWEEMALRAGASLVPSVQVLSGPLEIEALLADFGTYTHKTLTNLHAGLPPSSDQLAASVAADRALMDRGVVLRLVYPSAFLDCLGFSSYVAKMTGLGARVRFNDGVPHRLLVSDGRLAVVPVDNRNLEVGACVTTASQLVGGLAVLADILYRRGRTSDELRIADNSPPTPLELRLLKILSSGVSDTIAARRLGVSERTLRRYLNQLLGKLGAESRFQAGVRAIERGWL